jgi:hypothetical protein
MAAFPVPRCLAETAPREGGVRGWIVTLPGIVGTLRAAMVGGTVNDAPPWRAPMPGWPSAPAWPLDTSRGRARARAYWRVTAPLPVIFVVTCAGPL